MYGMVGGDLNAFIGGVHRTAIAFSNAAELASGCFSTNPEKNSITAREFGLDESRVYPSYEKMVENESKKLDFVSIVTPNSTHFSIAKLCLQAGMNVFCEKPMCVTLEQALELKKLAEKNNALLAVNYSYTGFVMAKVARELVLSGKLGDIISIHGQYLQEWLIDELGEKSSTAKLSAWRMDPKLSGSANCVGDIGTHIENLVSYITGLKIKRLCARLDRFGHPLDFNGNILLEYNTGATGFYTCSQVAIGEQNGLAVRIYGTKGSLKWFEEHPDFLIFCEKGGAPQTWSRGAGYLKSFDAAKWARIPAGHPEGLHEAFANIYKAFIDDIKAGKSGGDYPTAAEGAAGVQFIEAVLESDGKSGAWIYL
jgi:predicted dehydrogenase